MEKRLINLWVERMAEGYQDKELIEEAVSGSKKTSISTVEQNNKVVAFSIGEIGLFEDVISIPFNKIKHCGFSRDEKVGYLTICCVDKDFEGNGFAKKTTNEVVTELENSVEKIVSEGWKKEDKTDGSDVLKSVGFEEVFVDKEYWKYSTSDYNPCPNCGLSPCHCKGSLLVKK